MKRLKQFFTLISLVTGLAVTASAQQEIIVSPQTVNIYGQGSTSYLLTFGNLRSYRPAESTWCGDLIPALPDIGLKCSPATTWGRLPARYDQSRLSGVNAFTDIVSVSPSITRRAYQAAAGGQESIFYYVKRFINTAGGPDQYVFVGCRMTGGGARVPFSLTDVRLSFGAQRTTTESDAAPLVLFVEPGQKLPVVKAELTYTGTGRLKGRWEIVQPGDPLPEERDLLPEGALPIEERGKQRRYQDLGRFNVFLPPVGQFTLSGPDPARLPNNAAGQYLILLRIEATDDREADSDLAAVGAGAGVVHSGAVAGFALPALRYAVGGSNNAQTVTSNAAQRFAQLLPRDGLTITVKLPVDFVWEAVAQAAFYRLEIEDALGKSLLVATLRAGVTSYRAPSWLKEKTSNGSLRWRVVALDQAGKVIAETGYRILRLI
jgi:hypothetical protein